MISQIEGTQAKLIDLFDGMQASLLLKQTTLRKSSTTFVHFDWFRNKYVHLMTC